MTISTEPSPYQNDIARYWNDEERPVNLRLGAVDGLYHHHYGVGDVNWSVLETNPAERDQAIIDELHRLESAQAELLIDSLGYVAPEERILDA
ncbi:MAG TPA: SAM-dependent methyltransferase, partial [Streptomyces sp.]